MHSVGTRVGLLDLAKLILPRARAERGSGMIGGSSELGAPSLVLERMQPCRLRLGALCNGAKPSRLLVPYLHMRGQPIARRQTQLMAVCSEQPMSAASLTGLPRVELANPLATRAARRRGLVAGADLYRQAQLDIALALQARAARMVMACVPQIAGDSDDD